MKPESGTWPVRSRQFTLIELLVVIAIIGILASMLLPALQNALSTSRRVACMGNLRQLAMKVINYTDAYEDYYFVRWDQDGTWGIAWNHQKPSMYLMDGELTASPLYHCPTPFGPVEGYNWWETTNKGSELGEYHYWVDGEKVYTDYKTNDIANVLGEKVTKITNPSWFVVQKDNDWADIGIVPMGNHGGNNDKENLAFYDGHVETFGTVANRFNPAAGGTPDPDGDGPYWNWGN